MSNPDRLMILDLSAIEEERGSQPNDYFVCLTLREARACAAAIAHVLHAEACTRKECASCNEYRRLFWGLFNELGPRLQGEVRAHLGRANCPLPEGPWEEERA